MTVEPDGTRFDETAGRQPSQRRRRLRPTGSAEVRSDRLALHGEHDMATAADVSDAIAAVSGSVLVDLSNCDFVDSILIGTLFDNARRIRKSGNLFELVVPPSAVNVARTLELVHLEELLSDPPRPPHTATPPRPPRHSRPPCPVRGCSLRGNRFKRDRWVRTSQEHQGFESSVSDTGRLTLVASVIPARPSETRPPSPSRTPSRGRGNA